MIQLKFLEDLTGEDSSLSIGEVWFNQWNVFPKGVILVITLTDLIEFLNSKSKNTNWVGCDSGDYVWVNVEKGNIIFRGNQHEFKEEYDSFILELLKQAEFILSDLLAKRSDVVKEGAFIDLKSAIENSRR